MCYVAIERLNGRHDYYKLAKEMYDKGYAEDDIEYYNDDNQKPWEPCILPHLKFKNEGDAIAFCLAHGCTYSLVVPKNVDK